MNNATFTRILSPTIGLLFLLAFFFQIATAASLANPHHCSADAIKRAEKLLVLQAETELPVSLAKVVHVLKSLRNPANSKQWFDVLEITGYVYKAEYRMRFIYAKIPGQCALVGQEILEYTSL